MGPHRSLAPTASWFDAHYLQVADMAVSIWVIVPTLLCRHATRTALTQLEIGSENV